MKGNFLLAVFKWQFLSQLNAVNFKYFIIIKTQCLI